MRYVELERIDVNRLRVVSVAESAIVPKSPLIREAPEKFSNHELLRMVLDRDVWRWGRAGEGGRNGHGEPDDDWGMPIEPNPQNPELLASGHMFDRTGYGKLCRELLFRLANTFQVSIRNTGFAGKIKLDKYTHSRLMYHKRVKVSAAAPHLRVFTPLVEPDGGRHNVIFTMFETQTMHPGFIEILNRNYDECWVPSKWNRELFQSHGAKLPIQVMPLGINPDVFCSRPRTRLPKCTLLTTDRSGAVEEPSGFRFLSVGLPTFRKGYDVLVAAFEEAFGDDPDVSLVLGTTTYTAPIPPKIYAAGRKSKVYQLRGRFTELQMVNIYNSCDVYVSASRGEGWNLPLTEAAACGLPVIASRGSAHDEFLNDDNCIMFDADGIEERSEALAICGYYKGQKFLSFGERSIRQLAAALRYLKEDPNEEACRAKLLTKQVRTRYTWDRLASRATKRLLKIGGR